MEDFELKKKKKKSGNLTNRTLNKNGKKRNILKWKVAMECYCG